MFMEFRTVKNLVSKSDIIIPFCYIHSGNCLQTSTY